MEAPISPAKGLILVTGITGFLGSHVVHQLIEIGYSVRGITRSNKLSLVQEAFSQYGARFEAVVINDLVNGDFKHPLEGVQAVIHVAAVLPAKMTTAAQAMEVTIGGSLNILKQTEKAGVKTFVLASSIATAGKVNQETGQYEISDQIWTSVSEEAALGEQGKENPYLVYTAAKTLAERAVWDFAEKHPHVELTTVNPPILYGPFAPGYRNPDASLSALSTNSMLYDLLRPDGPPLLSPPFMDVRDAARALVNALAAPPTTQVGKKRMVMSGEWLSAKDVVEYIAQVRPALKDRLTKLAENAPPAPASPVDNTRAEEILKLEIGGWKDPVIGAIDDLIELEAEWKAKGLTPK